MCDQMLTVASIAPCHSSHIELNPRLCRPLEKKSISQRNVSEEVSSINFEVFHQLLFSQVAWQTVFCQIRGPSMKAGGETSGMEGNNGKNRRMVSDVQVNSERVAGNK